MRRISLWSASGFRFIFCMFSRPFSHPSDSSSTKVEMDDPDRLFGRLPEGCISHILSYTTPRDACRSSTLSHTFKSASESDTVWEKFLPSDCSEILSKSVNPVEFSSKKELYFRLCDPILIDGGKMSFSIEKTTGKKCFMLSARELSIVWGDTPSYWKWTNHPQSRFAEVAVLNSVCWLEIHGLINSRMLSPKTTYSAHFIMGYDVGSHGLEFPLAEVSVRLGSQVSEHTASLQSEENRSNRDRLWNMLNRPNMWRRTGAGNARCTARVPLPRSNGWSEIELGDCYNDEGDEGKVNMSLLEVKGGNWKAGVIIEGIEIRPKV
ncbi:F-box protein PP2-B10-like [Magnolia sinica]|uniref:F-box protein PP2-B10-like n=1 Tax=Magnolia sinica TaxID=86752 RepID=UPI0026580C4B|nr:F-box protein PP2-B10-like [Magnolia sinica]